MINARKPLTKLDQTALSTIIKRHELYRQGRSGGVRAQLMHYDLSHLVFRGCDLSHADFSGSLFYEADLTHANLDYSVFFASDLRRANLHNATLIRADLRGACLRGASMSGVNLSDADLREGSFAIYDPKKGLDFVNDDSTRMEGTGAVDLRGATLASAVFSGSNATNANFADANLNKASFIRGDLSGANLSGANLIDADLSHCVLKNVNMRGAVLVGTVIDFSRLVNVDMAGALTDKPAGKLLSQQPVSLEELLKLHKVWLNSKGAKGVRLDLSGFDLRSITLLTKEDLTMLIAKQSVWFGQNLSHTHMQATQFEKSDMRNCNFESADLRGSSFLNANLIGAKFCKASLEPLLLDDGRALGTNFTGASLRYADFTYANLRDADFSDADLSFTDFTGADTQGANFSNTVQTETKASLKTLNKSTARD